MLYETIQGAAETAKQGLSFTVAIPTAAITSFFSILILKLAEALIRHRRNGSHAKAEKAESAGPKPGEGKKCQEHGEAISALEEAKGNTAIALERIEGKLDALLLRRVGE